MTTCLKCSKQFVTGTQICPYCSTPISKAPVVTITREMMRGRGLKEYKVISAEDRWLIGGRFDKQSLQNMLNSYAVHGWSVNMMTINKTTGLFTGWSRDEMMIVLERDVDYVDDITGEGKGGDTDIGDFI